VHSYGSDFKHVAYVHVVLAAISLGLYLALKLLPLPSNFPVHPLITLTIFGIVEFLFNQWGWRLLCLFPIVRVYNFGGTYEGHMRAADDATYPVKLTVKQNWSRMEIVFESGDARSKSFSASVIRDRIANGQVELVYNYFAHGVHEGEERVGAHYGTSMLRRLNQGLKLDGNYYTERQRDSFGRVELKKI
jgi:hypothetical protein